MKYLHIYLPGNVSLKLCWASDFCSSATRRSTSVVSNESQQLLWSPSWQTVISLVIYWLFIFLHHQIKHQVHVVIGFMTKYLEKWIPISLNCPLCLILVSKDGDHDHYQQHVIHAFELMNVFVYQLKRNTVIIESKWFCQPLIGKPTTTVHTRIF